MMDATDSVAVSSAAVHCKISRGVDGKTYSALVTNLPEVTEVRYEVLTRQFRFLLFGVCVVFLMISPLVALLSVQKISDIRSVDALDSQSVRTLANLRAKYEVELQKSLDKTVANILKQSETAFSSFNGRLQKTLADSRTKFDKKIDTDLDQMRSRIDGSLKNSEISANHTVSAAFVTMKNRVSNFLNETNKSIDTTVNMTTKKAQDNLNEVVRQSLAEVATLVNQTVSSSDALTTQILNASLSAVDLDISEYITQIRYGFHFGTTVGFEIDPVLAELQNSTTNMAFSQHKIVHVGAIALAVQIKAVNKVKPSIGVQFGCVERPFTPFRYPLQKNIEFSMLNTDNLKLYQKIYWPKDMPSCLDPIKTAWDKQSIGFTDTVDRLRRANLVKDGCLRYLFRFLR